MTPAPARLRDDALALETLVAATASARGLNAAFVEKDFWVIEALRAASAFMAASPDAAGATAIFKGGTSLSRVFGLIERFSEDVDLLLDFPDTVGKGRRERVLKGLSRTVQRHFGLPDELCASDSQNTGVARNTRFLYPRHNQSVAISDGVYLEMGTRGGAFPTSVHAVRSLAADFAIEDLHEEPGTWAEFASVRVTVLAPERTLLEKLMLLNTFGAAVDAGEGHALDRHGRHLYDIHQLLGAPTVTDALRGLGAHGVASLCHDIHERSLASGFRSQPRPNGGFARSSVFSAHSAAGIRLRAAYTASLDLIWGEHRPDFDECLATVRTHAALL